MTGLIGEKRWQTRWVWGAGVVGAWGAGVDGACAPRTPASRCIGACKPSTSAFLPHGLHPPPSHGRPFVPLEQGLNVSAPHEPFQCERAGRGAADCWHDRRGELRRPSGQLSPARLLSGSRYRRRARLSQASRRASGTRGQPCLAPGCVRSLCPCPARPFFAPARLAQAHAPLHYCPVTSLSIGTRMQGP